MSHPSQAIEIENCGPIGSLAFRLEDYGVTTLVAPNACGKSTALQAVQTAARGDGKLPLKDRTKRGKVEAFGAKITIGGTTRHTGDFEVTNLEGRFDIGALIDPKIKAPAAADAARIKALIALTGVKADPTLFKQHEAFADFDTIVTPDCLATDDLVEMARRVKSKYEASARMAEGEADREEGHAASLASSEDVKADEEFREDVLQAAYDAARDEVTKLKAAFEAFEKSTKDVAAARELLAELQEEATFPVEEINNQINQHLELLEKTERTVAELEDSLAQARALVKDTKAGVSLWQERQAGEQRRIAAIERANKVVAACQQTAAPSLAATQSAELSLSLAKAAVDRGSIIRQAKRSAARAESHRKLAAQAREKAARLRNAGKSTDEVLSGAIQCDRLRVESDGTAARLVTDTARGQSITYHELSDGERGEIAVDIGAGQVGPGGLLVVGQPVWEGLDGSNRLRIHEKASARQVYILTAEATEDPDAPKEIIPTPFAMAAV
jgi:predicted ATP-binding protein involved in virulence